MPPPSRRYCDPHRRRRCQPRVWGPALGQERFQRVAQGQLLSEPGTAERVRLAASTVKHTRSAPPREGFQTLARPRKARSTQHATCRARQGPGAGCPGPPTKTRQPDRWRRRCTLGFEVRKGRTPAKAGLILPQSARNQVPLPSPA